ncbi:hypothetical protein CLAIMM_14601 [Cladophialophora immunda]|nr:hypothetical protein CLAIMM_14601 [Cladophialophora immunda]
MQQSDTSLFSGTFNQAVFLSGYGILWAICAFLTVFTVAALHYRWTDPKGRERFATTSKQWLDVVRF